MSSNSSAIYRFTRRATKLPHWQLPRSTYFVTAVTLRRCKLDDQARSFVLHALQHFDGARYDLWQAVVMHDHFHALLTPSLKTESGYWDLSSLLGSIKGYSAWLLNKHERVGQIWQRESYDRIVRDQEEFNYFFNYIFENPTANGEVGTGEPYEWYYVSQKIKGSPIFS